MHFDLWPAPMRCAARWLAATYSRRRLYTGIRRAAEASRGPCHFEMKATARHQARRGRADVVASTMDACGSNGAR